MCIKVRWWTIGRMQLENPEIDDLFAELARPGDDGINLRIQSLRILAHRVRNRKEWRPFPEDAYACLTDAEQRVRFEAVLALRRGIQKQAVGRLLDCLAIEGDRLVFYAGWQTVRVLMACLLDPT